MFLKYLKNYFNYFEYDEKETLIYSKKRRNRGTPRVCVYVMLCCWINNTKMYNINIKR